MGTYYVMIRWGSNFIAVTGFLVPLAKDERDAITLVKNSLIEHSKTFPNTYGDLSKVRIKDFLRSLKHYYRRNSRGDSIVKVKQVTSPIYTGYWLQEVGHKETLCNTVDWKS